MKGKSLYSLDDLMRPQEQNNSVEGRSLYSLDDIIKPSIPERQDAGYGEVLGKAIKSFPTAIKGTSGQLLQGLAEAPEAALQGLLENEYSPEDSFLDTIKKGLYNQGNTLKFAATAIPAAIGEYFTGDLAEEGKQIQREAGEKLASPEYNAYVKETLSPKGIVNIAAKSLAQQIPGIAASVATKNPAYLFGQGGLTALGEGYSKQREAGKTPSESLGPAALNGLAEVFLSKLPIDILLKPGSNALKRILSEIIAEGGTEAATEGVQNAIEKYTIDPEMSIEEIANNMLIAGLAGATAGGALATVTAPFIKGEKAKENKPVSINQEKNNILRELQETEALNALEQVSEISEILAPEENILQEETPITEGTSDPIEPIKVTTEEVVTPDEIITIEEPVDAKDIQPTQITPEEFIQENKKVEIQDNLPARSDKALANEHKQDIEQALFVGEPITEEAIDSYPEYSGLKKYMEYVAPKNKLTEEITNNLKQINPDINIEFVNKLFGNGEALVRSGAPTTRRTEVAGQYNKSNNLITVALNQNPEKIMNTAYHEVFHSLEDTLNPKEKAILEKAFPKKGKKTSIERQAEAFADYMVGIKTPTKATSSAFSKLKNTISKIGDVLKNNKIESAEHIFSSIGKGELVTRPITSAEIIDSIDNNDINTLYTANKLDLVSSKDKKQVPNDLKSPALNDIAKSNMDHESISGLAEVIADTSNNPEDKAYSLKTKVFQGTIGFLENATTKAIEIVAPIMPEKVTEANLKRMKKVFDITFNAADEGNITESLKNLFNLITRSNDGFIRVVAEKNDSSTATEIADMFYPDIGSGREIGRDYFDEKRIFINNALSRLDKAIGNLDEDTVMQMAPYLQGYKQAIPGTDLYNRLNDLKLLQNDIYEYLTSSGIQVGKIENYFGRIYDTSKIIDDPKKFLKLAAEAEKITAVEKGSSISDSKARELADEWLERVQMEEEHISTNFFSRSKGPATPNSLKERKLSKEADEIMRPFLVQNPLDVMALHITSAANKVSFDKRFGGDKAALLQDRLEKNGTNKDVALGLAQVVRDNKLDNIDRDTSEEVLGKRIHELKDLLEAEGIDNIDNIINEVVYLWKRNATNRWQALERQMLDEGVNGNDIQNIIDIIKQNTGINIRSYGKGIREITSLAKTYSYIASLVRTAITAAGEFVGTGVQTGSPKFAFKALSYRARNIYNMIKHTYGFNKSDRYAFLEEANELMGIVGDRAQEALMLSRFGIDAAGKYSSMVSTRFFDVTLQNGLTKADLMSASECGQLFFKSLAKKIITNSSRKESSKFLFKDYGIPEDKIEEFTKYVMKASEAFGKQDIDFIKEKGEMADLYVTALNRFVGSVIMMPNASIRHRIGNDPIGSLIYGFLSYSMAYTKRVLIRSYKLAKNTSNNPNYTLGDKIQLASSMAMLPVAGLFGNLVQAIKASLRSKEEEQAGWWDLLDAMSQASFFGGFDPLYGIVKSQTFYNQDAAFTGPAAGNLLSLFNTTLRLYTKNSESTNAAERKAAKQWYNLVLLPILNGAIATYSPFSTPAAALIQYINLPGNKEGVIDTLVGEYERKKKVYTPEEKKARREKAKEKRLEKLKEKYNKE